MYDFAIESLQIISAGLQPTGIKVRQPFMGLEAPDFRLNQFSNPGRDGGTTSSAQYDFRNIQFEGSVKGRTYEEYHQLRRDLLAAVAIQRDQYNNPVPRRITFTTLDGQSYFADVHFKKPLMSLEYPMYCNFMITGSIDDGVIYGQNTVTSGNISRPTGGGYLLPAIIPYVLTASTGGSVTLTNDGDEITWPKIDNDGNGGIVLTGSLTNPILSNLTTGKTLELNYTIQSGDYVQIDMARQLILLNGSSTLISTKTPTSDWWGLAPGVNLISLDTSSGADGGYADITYNPAFIGV